MKSWECHRCGTVNAPHVSACNCKRPAQDVVAVPGTRPPIMPTGEALPFWTTVTQPQYTVHYRADGVSA